MPRTITGQETFVPRAFIYRISGSGKHLDAYLLFMSIYAPDKTLTNIIIPKVIKKVKCNLNFCN